ncbi:hypothetical protein ACJMK2_041513 [Sinanodonta woodiana]|uniref:R-spondin Fu-CRD domain-containing protein n=1 Tax=Sinanodonta woodiana TaxID=1069815 RepID=A0ABD3W7N9_SINWO
MQCRVTVLTSLLLMLCHVTAWMVSNETGLLAREKRNVNGQDPTCPTGCTDCSEYNGCTSCLSNLYLLLVRNGMRQTGECVHACPDGFYGVRRTIYNICNKCHTPHCEACFSKQYCTRCTPPYINYRGQCLWRCPKNLHYANYSKECKEKVDCMVGPWGSWSSCTRDGRTCGYKYGITIRSRKVIEHPSVNGERCPSLLENRCCRMAMRHCSDVANNNSDLNDVNRVTRVNQSSRRHRIKTRKHRKDSKRRKNRKHRGRKDKNKNRNKKTNKKRNEKRAWGRICRGNVVFNDINENVYLFD